MIIPVFNTLEFLEDCIDSVINQTYRHFEIILVNDGSNKETENMLITYSNKYENIYLYNFSERVGVGAARNFGVSKSTGSYIYFLDSDDYLPNMALELLVNNIKGDDMIRGRIKHTTFSNGEVVLLQGLMNPKYYEGKKFNSIKNKSALNTLIRKDFIIENNLRFSEELDIYSDITFLVSACIATPRVPYLKEAIYFRRKRNDAISNPSLSQSALHEKVYNFLRMYKSLKETIEDEQANAYLDKEFLNFYRKQIVTCFKDITYIDMLYPALQECVKLTNKQLIQNYSWVLRNEVNALLNDNQKKYKRIMKRHQLLRDIKVGLGSKRKFYLLLYRRVFQKMKVKENVVFFESFLGKNYSDNPKYIYEKMLEKNMPYKYVWCFREDKNIPGNAIQVKRFSLKYYYYLARAKYWVSNSRLPKSLNKRKENIYLQTWHGTPLKTLVFDINDIHSADPNYKKNFYEQSRRWDYLNSPNQYSSDIFRRAFKYDKTMLEFGYPRNDILYQKNNKNDIDKLKDKIGIPKDKKVILYAPTWRDDEFFSRGNYKFTLNLDLAKMQDAFAAEYILLLRTHYHIANNIDVSEFEGFVYDASHYDDIAELYLASDMLITDYSSVFFDYAHLQRPILFYTYDLEKYRDSLRGMYFDMQEECPGPLLMTTEDVVESITDIVGVTEKYKDKYNAFYDKFCQWDDGHASEKTIEAIFKD